MGSSPSQVVTRFAPSPTGFLHIGGARTALFNFLFARHHGGQFLLRIEDTDRERSTQPAIDAILDGMRWLDFTWDGEVVYQFARQQRHAEVARELLDKGHAYYCYATPAELEEMRETAKREGRPMRYDGRWRDRDPSEAPAGVKPVIRLKAPREGEVTIHDLVQGPVTVSNEQLDDMILLRADGTPTYMLAVVVDDHDMGVTHVIRGDDHLNNAFRQLALIRAMGWPEPHYAHIPLIHGADGAKLSKRHGALGVTEYREMGFLAEAVENYLLRLGWGHGDAEIISRAQAVEWFDIGAVGRSASRFDIKKLENLNGHYMREADDERLVRLVLPLIGEALERPLLDREILLLQRSMKDLKVRAKTLRELAHSALFYFRARPIPLDEAALKLLQPAPEILREARKALADVPEWRADLLEASVRVVAERLGLGLGKVAQPLRAALTGSNMSPGIFDVLDVLGREESLARIDDGVAAVTGC
ncbi:glutamate--tRNA ligase [Parapedomonas caeni]